MPKNEILVARRIANLENHATRRKKRDKTASENALAKK